MRTKILINSLGGGGAERQVTYLHKDIPNLAIYTLENVSAYPHTPYHALVVGPRSDYAFIKIVQLAIAVAQWIRTTTKDDVVVSLLTRANIVNAIAQRYRGYTAIVSERQALRTTTKLTRYRKYQLALRGILYKKVHTIVVNSNGTKNDLIRWCQIEPEKIKVIYNVCDIHRIRQQAQETIPTHQRPYIIASGRLDDQKGYDHLIRIYSAYRQQSENPLDLVILGEGPRRKELTKLIADYNNSAHIHLVGFQHNPFPWLQQAELMVMTSRFEGFPNVLLEALAVGTPVISTDCPYGPREILAPSTETTAIAREREDHEYGILLPRLAEEASYTVQPLSNTEQIYTDTLIELLTSPVKRAQYQAVSAEAVRHYTPERMSEAWKNLLATVKNRSRIT